jgi:hypothetical protein
MSYRMKRFFQKAICSPDSISTVSEIGDWWSGSDNKR